MSEPCFKRKDSNPPACGVHDTRLVQKKLPVKMVASGYSAFRFLVCPVSGTVLNDKEKHV
jgi:hypothetical protein